MGLGDGCPQHWPSQTFKAMERTASSLEYWMLAAQDAGAAALAPMPAGASQWSGRAVKIHRLGGRNNASLCS